MRLIQRLLIALFLISAVQLVMAEAAMSCVSEARKITSYCQQPSTMSRLLDVVWPDSKPYQVAVVAGVSKYPYLPDQEQLPPVDYDVDTLTELLRDRFKFDEVIVLKNADFSVQNLRYVFSEYIPDVLRQHGSSQVLFAYSGHGADFEHTGYLFLNDTTSIDPHSYEDLANAIDMDELKILMKPTIREATHFLALVNSCKGGYFVESGTFVFGGAQLSARGAHGITAGGKENYVHAKSNVGSGRGSVFFEMLFTALKGESVNLNGVNYSDPAGDDGILSSLKLSNFLNNTILRVEDYDFGPQMGRLYPPDSKSGEGYFFFITNEARARQALQSRYPETWQRMFGGGGVVPSTGSGCPYVIKAEVAATGPDFVPCRTPGYTFRDCANCPEMVVVAPGNFGMGSDDNSSFNREHLHQVSIRSPLAVGKYEITFSDWDECLSEGGCSGTTPDDEGWGRGKQPAINVSWYMAKEYTRWLSRKTGEPYRLLSEAEWEYTARGGKQDTYFTGDTIDTFQANFDGTRFARSGDTKGAHRDRPVPVGSFAPNSFGIFDMAGNVWEWTEDCYRKKYGVEPADGSAWLQGDCATRVIRGGGWNSSQDDVASASRSAAEPTAESDIVGFRVAKLLTQN
ncbi:Serine/threonine-protein kinase pkn1 [Ensifer adhaerens]|nr:Serine/threonine-protein kinase pkn1 [Ensifer adhaerens]